MTTSSLRSSMDDETGTLTNVILRTVFAEITCNYCGYSDLTNKYLCQESLQFPVS